MIMFIRRKVQENTSNQYPINQFWNEKLAHFRLKDSALAIFVTLFHKEDAMKTFKANGLYLFVACAMLIMSTKLVCADPIENAMAWGGDRLVALQNNDGGWDWPLDDGDPGNASPRNTIGPVGMGLAQAYLEVEKTKYRRALRKAGRLLLRKRNNFSPSDVISLHSSIRFLRLIDIKGMSGNTFTESWPKGDMTEMVRGPYMTPRDMLT